MKRIIILVGLVVLAGIAGVVVRSSSNNDGTVAELRGLVSHSAGDVRDEIRQSYELSPDARVELSSLNGSVKIETSDTKTAEIYIERTASSQEALNRRRVTVDADASGLRIRGEKIHSGFFAELFGSKASEKATLKLPRQVSLYVKGVNGSVTVGELDGAVEVGGINGRVQIASATGVAVLKGINGNVVVGLQRLQRDGMTLSGINGNIELRLGADVNADFDARGMNGRVVSDLPNVAIDKARHGSYSARIGTGGNAISAKGINGNIRLTREAPFESTEAGKE